MKKSCVYILFAGASISFLLNLIQTLFSLSSETIFIINLIISLAFMFIASGLALICAKQGNKVPFGKMGFSLSLLIFSLTTHSTFYYWYYSGNRAIYFLALLMILLTLAFSFVAIFFSFRNETECLIVDKTPSSASYKKEKSLDSDSELTEEEEEKTNPEQEEKKQESFEDFDL